MVKKFITKPAFTMIELIFAIVVIGISVLSLPTVMGVTNKGIESNIVQEAIFASSAELMGATSGYWDERSLDDVAYSKLSRVIDINGDCNNTSTSDRFRLRPGHIPQPYHRRCLDDSSTTGLDSNTNSTVTSLDDAVHTAQGLFTDYNTEAAGYKVTYDSTISVTRAGNIKTITINVYENGTTNLITSLKTMSANIGETEFYKRSM